MIYLDFSTTSRGLEFVDGSLRPSRHIPGVFIWKQAFKKECFSTVSGIISVRTTHPNMQNMHRSYFVSEKQCKQELMSVFSSLHPQRLFVSF